MSHRSRSRSYSLNSARATSRQVRRSTTGRRRVTRRRPVTAARVKMDERMSITRGQTLAEVRRREQDRMTARSGAASDAELRRSQERAAQDRRIAGRRNPRVTLTLDETPFTLLGPAAKAFMAMDSSGRRGPVSGPSVSLPALSPRSPRKRPPPTRTRRFPKRGRGGRFTR